MEYKITIIGLGAGDLNQLPLGIYRRLQAAEHVFVRTLEHPVITTLLAEGMQLTSFDEVYESNQQFEDVYREIANRLLKQARSEDVLYAVPGHPMIAERTVQLLIQDGETNNIKVVIEGGQSFLDAMFTAIQVDPVEGFQFLDGTALTKSEIQVTQHVVISQVYDQFIASDVKLALMEKYPDEHQVFVVTNAGMDSQTVEKRPLFELDHAMKVSNLTSVYVPPVNEEQSTYKEFWKLRKIIADLRGPNGCPWDKEQTHEKLKGYLLEEAYEVIDAINVGDLDGLVEELGDILLQVMLHAQIGEDDGYFSIEDVIAGISEKMVRRHPHVFGSVEANTSEEVITNWQKIKETEKGKRSELILDGINPALPTLLQAYEIQKKASKVGFDWKDIEPAWDKVIEEMAELKQECGDLPMSADKVELEFGDVLFSLVNVARLLHIHPEEALHRTNQKFKHRFAYIEQKVKESRKSWDAFTLEELDAWWNECKEKER